MNDDFLPASYQPPKIKMKPIIQRNYPTIGTKSCKQFFSQLEDLYTLIDNFYFDFFENVEGNISRDPETGEFSESEERVLKEYDSHFEILDQLVYCRAVDGFENYIIQVGKEVLKQNGSSLEFELSFNIPINKINSKDLVLEEINNQIDNKILERYSGNKKELCNKFSKDFGISPIDNTKKENIERIFQIRNLFTHTNGVINKEYPRINRIMKAKGISIGKKLILSKDEVQDDLSLITKVIVQFDEEILNKYKLEKYNIEPSKSYNTVYM